MAYFPSAVSPAQNNIQLTGMWVFARQIYNRDEGGFDNSL
jgi:hypothetical protein